MVGNKDNDPPYTLGGSMVALPNENHTKMEYINIVKFCTEEEIVHIVPAVRANENGYKFLTMVRIIDGANKSDNIYMAKTTAKQYEVGQVLSNEELKKFSVCHTTNNDGEPRTKLTVGASTWVAVKDLF